MIKTMKIIKIIYYIVAVLHLAFLIAAAIVLIKHLNTGYRESAVWQEGLNYYVNQFLRVALAYAIIIPIGGILHINNKRKVNLFLVIIDCIVTISAIVLIIMIDNIYWITNVIIVLSFITIAAIPNIILNCVKKESKK